MSFIANLTGFKNLSGFIQLPLIFVEYYQNSLNSKNN